MTTKKQILLASLYAVMLIAGTMIAFNMLSPRAALAAGDTSSTANHFGQGASQLGQSGDMGTHSSSTQGGGEQTQPRLGIGNVGSALCGERLTPGELADVLNTFDPSTGQVECPPNTGTLGTQQQASQQAGSARTTQ